MRAVVIIDKQGVVRAELKNDLVRSISLVLNAFSPLAVMLKKSSGFLTLLFILTSTVVMFALLTGTKVRSI